MTKSVSRASVREQKAEALDVLVKKEIARTKVADLAKIDRLRALRVAREEQQQKEDDAAARQNTRDRPKRKTMHLHSPGQ